MGMFKASPKANKPVGWAGSVLPRQVWRGARDPKAIDLARRRVNKQASRMIRLCNGAVIQQPGIYYSTPFVFRGDRVHLSAEEMDIWRIWRLG